MNFGIFWLSKFYMVEYCEIFKMKFSKILDFLLRLKIRCKAPTRYKYWLRKSKLLLVAIFCYSSSYLADTLVGGLKFKVDLNNRV